MKKIILIVEDTEDILLNLQGFFIMEGYEVPIARNGKDALAYLQDHQPDLIITDLLMKEMTGFELITELKKQERLKVIPILIFSARPIKNENLNIEEIGADRFILKPCPPEELLQHISELIR